MVDNYLCLLLKRQTERPKRGANSGVMEVRSSFKGLHFWTYSLRCVANDCDRMSRIYKSNKSITLWNTARRSSFLQKYPSRQKAKKHRCSFLPRAASLQLLSSLSTFWVAIVGTNERHASKERV
jgi:hypothetical protein